MIVYKLYETESSDVSMISEDEFRVYRYLPHVEKIRMEKKQSLEFNSNDIKKYIASAINMIVKTFPTSLGVILQRKPVVIVKESSQLIKRMATDGELIYINPGWIADMIRGVYPKVDYRNVMVIIVYVLAHEAMHVIFRHAHEEWEGKYPDHTKANVSQDAHINLYVEHTLAPKILKETGKSISGVHKLLHIVYDESFANKDWTQIYKIMPKDYPFLLPKSKRQTSPEWKRGFIDGYEKVMKMLRDKKLIERVVI